MRDVSLTDQPLDSTWSEERLNKNSHPPILTSRVANPSYSTEPVQNKDTLVPLSNTFRRPDRSLSKGKAMKGVGSACVTSNRGERRKKLTFEEREEKVRDSSLARAEEEEVELLEDCE